LQQRLRLLQVFGVKPFGEPGSIGSFFSLAHGGSRLLNHCSIGSLTHCGIASLAHGAFLHEIHWGNGPLLHLRQDFVKDCICVLSTLPVSTQHYPAKEVSGIDSISCVKLDHHKERKLQFFLLAAREK
jgi:hypothetical protein